MSGTSPATGSGAPPPPPDAHAMLAQLQQQMLHMQQHMQQQAVQHAQQIAAAQQAAAAAAAARPSSRPKLAPAMRYTGTTNTMDAFLRVMSQHIEYYGLVNDADKLQFAFGHLDGAALVWLNKMAAADRPATWAQFVERLQLRFQPTNASVSARIDIRHQKQGDDSVSKYTNRFQAVLAPIEDMSETDKKFAYIFGLNRFIIGRVMERLPSINTLAQAIEVATAVEASQTLLGRSAGSSHHGRYGASSSSSSAPMDINNIAHEEPEDEIEAPRFHEEPRSVEAAMMAKFESMLDHRLAALNFSAPKAFSKDNDRVSGLKSGDIGRLMKEGKCFRCQKTGHMKRDCPLGKPKSANGKSVNW